MDTDDGVDRRPLPRIATTDENYMILLGVQQLPLPDDRTDGRRWDIRRATAMWLASRKSKHTRRAYFRDLADFLAWSEQAGLDPRFAHRADIDTYMLRFRDRPATARALRLSILSSWYGYLMSNGVVPANPAGAVDRPSVDRDASPTAALSAVQVGVFMRAARNMPGKQRARNAAMCGFMAELGLRVGEVCALQRDSLRTNRGHRTVRVIGKGGRWRELPIPVPLGRDLDRWLEQRGNISSDAARSPHLFITTAGRAVTTGFVFVVVQKIAEAAGFTGVKITPHSLRHTVATAALDEGATLRDVQDLLGHADPRTTRRYDRSRGNLDRSPAYLIAKLFAEDDDDAQVGRGGFA